MTEHNLTVIGRAERVQLIDHDEQPIPAKVDTGADSSSIWASNIREHDDRLEFVLFDEGSRYYTGEVISLPKADFRLTRVANSFGQREMRYVVKMRIAVLGRIVKATFTLADRSTKTYPILLGRRLLKNKFLVDVAKGDPLLKEEKAKLEALRVALAMDED